MRILMIAENYLPTIGGVTRHVSGLSQELVRRGHEVQVFCLNKSEPKKLRREKIAGVSILRLPAESKCFQQELNRQAYLYSQVEVIQVHDFGNCVRFIFPFCMQMPNLPLFMTFHGYEGQLPVAANIRRLRQACWGLALGTVNIGTLIEEWYGTPADLILSGGLETTQLAPPTEPPNNYEFIFIGRLEADNPLFLYLETLGRLREKNVPATLTLCGPGALKDQLIASAEALKVPLRVLEPTYETMPLRAQARFILGGGWLSILEGLASHRVVFSAGHTTATRAALRAHPAVDRCFPAAENSEELLDKIMSVVANPQLEMELTKRGYEFAGTCTWENVCTQYLDLWTSKLDNPQRNTKVCCIKQDNTAG